MRRRATRIRLPWIFGAGLALLAVGGSPIGASSPSSLGVILTAAPHVRVATRAALVHQATAIWREAGLPLEWIAPTTPPRPDVRTLRLLVVPRSSPQRAAETAVLGELLRTEDARAVAIVSLVEAERIVARMQTSRLAGMYEARLGVVLGRAAAHEIGHYVLDTASHADYGLMRARFTEAEFADPDSMAFALDQEATRWVQQRIAHSLPFGPAMSAHQVAATIGAPQFTYSR